MPAPIYRFGRFRLDPARRALHRDAAALTPASSTFDLIVYLLAHADRAVGRDELGAAVWGRTDVSDTVLGQTVLKARRVLDDDGRQQAAILTVPRFGYRWVMPFEVALAPDAVGDVGAIAVAAPGGTADVNEIDTSVAPSAAFAAGDVADHADALVQRPLQAADDVPAEPPPAPSIDNAAVAADRPSRSDPIPPPADAALPRRWWLPVATLLLVAAAGVYIGSARRDAAAPVAAAPTVPGNEPTAAIPIVAAGSTLVLPAQIDAADSDQWLRLGVMDLVAGRLREGGVATLPSETVLGALARDPQALLPGRLAADVLRTRVARDADAWTVTLERDDDGDDLLRIDARDADPIVAARRATDLWLVHLGRVPPPAVSAELEELLHRVRAATLSDQLRLAHDLLDAAPAELRDTPQLIHRRAQLALREGDYPAVEALLQPALAQVSESDQRVLRARLLVTLAAAELRQRKNDLGRLHYGAAIDLLADGSDPATRGTALLGRGSVDAIEARYDIAVADLGHARSELRSANDALGLAQVDLNLAQIARMRERPNEALPMLDGARRRFLALGAVEEAAFATASLAEVHAELLDHARALATLDSVWPPEEQVGNVRLRWTLTMLRARLLANQGRFAAAIALLEPVLRDADPRLDRMARARAATLLFQFAAAGDDAAATQAALDVALAAAAPDLDPCAWVHGQRVRLATLRGSDPAAAAADLAALVDLSTRWQGMACMHIGIAMAQAAASDWPAAREHFAAALAEAERLGIPEALVDVAFGYVDALVAHGDFEAAESLSGRVSPWAETDFRAAAVQARVYGARGNAAAWRRAVDTAQQLAGERTFEPHLGNVVR